MKTVLHIITGLEDGGAEAVLFRLCTQDRTMRHEVISMIGPGKYGPLFEAAGIPVHALAMSRGRVTLPALWQLWRKIRRSRAEVVQTWMYHANFLGGIAARMAGKRNICWGIHHSTIDPARSPRRTIWVAKACARISRLVPRRIICCAEKSRQVHVALGYDAGRMVAIPNGYDLAVFQPDPIAGASLRASLGLDPHRAVIGFVARFDPQKDHANLLQALSLLQKRQICPVCLLVGDGLEPENRALVALIAELGLDGQVRLLGRRSDIPAVMNALDLHVMSSAFGEAFPNVLAEAMACGTPCVSTDLGDAAVILGATGRIVPPRNPSALAAATEEMLRLSEGAGWGERCKAARQHVAENFSITRMVEDYHRIWLT